MACCYLLLLLLLLLLLWWWCWCDGDGRGRSAVGIAFSAGTNRKGTSIAYVHRCGCGAGRPLVTAAPRGSPAEAQQLHTNIHADTHRHTTNALSTHETHARTQQADSRTRTTNVIGVVVLAGEAVAECVAHGAGGEAVAVELQAPRLLAVARGTTWRSVSRCSGTHSVDCNGIVGSREGGAAGGGGGGAARD